MTGTFVRCMCGCRTLLAVSSPQDADRQERVPWKEAGLALAGLVLGWGAVILGIVLIAVALAIAAGMCRHAHALSSREACRHRATPRATR